MKPVRYGSGLCHGISACIAAPGLCPDVWGASDPTWVCRRTGDAIGVSWTPKGRYCGLRLSAFVVGSFSYNSHIQMVPEFAGADQPSPIPARRISALTNLAWAWPKRLPRGCRPVPRSKSRTIGTGIPTALTRILVVLALFLREQFGAEEAEFETNLDRFHITAIAPLGNGLALSFGRFDVPFGIERHDEPLLLTATTSEVFRFGRPDRMTGFQGELSVCPVARPEPVGGEPAGE